MLDKIYECLCDNPTCLGAVILHSIIGSTKEQTKEQLRKVGAIVVGDKCYCDQECFDTRKDKDPDR